MRQAYDYWQNQPGNYPESAPTLWWTDAEAPRKERSFGYKDGARRSIPSHERPTRRTYKTANGHSIAPTEFPKEQSAAEVIGSRDHQTPLHVPFRWREPTPSHARRRIPARAYPRRSERMVAISQPSTDSIMCPLTQEPTGLLLPPRAQPQCQKVGLTRFEQAARKDLARRRRADQSWHSLPLQRKRSEPTRNQTAKAAKISRPAELGGWKQQGPAKRRARHPSCWPGGALGEPIPHPQTRHEAELWGDPAPKTPHTYSNIH